LAVRRADQHEGASGDETPAMAVELLQFLADRTCGRLRRFVNRAKRFMGSDEIHGPLPLFFLEFLVERMAHDQRHLAESEEQRDWPDAPDLEGDPGVRGEGPPDDLVDDSQEQEEQTPAQGQLAPAFRVEVEGRIEYITE